jgi:hypothetical protein
LAITLEQGCAAQTWARAPQPESVVLVGASLAVRWRDHRLSRHADPRRRSSSPSGGILVFGKSSSIGGKHSTSVMGPTTTPP